MIARILRESFRRQKRRKAVALAAVAFGTAAATALANVALDVGDSVSRELRRFGANLVVLPAGGSARVVVGSVDLSSFRARSFLRAEDLPKVKENFWKNNILDFAPMLDETISAGGRSARLRGCWFDRRLTLSDGRTIHTGLRGLFPYWKVQGDWPSDLFRPSDDEILAGASAAVRLGLKRGASVALRGDGGTATATVVGILTSGGEEDDLLLAPMETVWRLTGREGAVDRVLVSAATTPEDAVYERLGRSPRELSPKEFESWSCTPFVSSIAYELARAVPGSEALPIRRVADTEGKVLGRIGALMGFVALMAAIGSALTVTGALTTGVLERRAEIGLLKALGAGNGGVIGLFLAEAFVIGLAGGLLGAGMGLALSRVIAASVFGAAGSVKLVSVPIAMAAALVITLAGCLAPARRIASIRSAEALKG